MIDGERMMIGFSGAHGGGKTTLVDAVAKSLGADGFKVQVAPEIPRLIIKELGDETFFQRAHNTLARQMLVLTRQVLFDSGIEGAGIVLYDRTLVDHWAYTSVLHGKLLDQRAIDAWRAFVANYCRRYRVIFYVPSEFEPASDGVREADSLYQAEVDVALRGLLRSFGVALIEVRGSLEARVQQVRARLADYL